MRRPALFSLLCSVTCLHSLAVLVQAAQQQPFIKPNWFYADCGQATDAIRIDSLELYPDTPQKGENHTLTVVSTARRTVEEGAYADVIIKIGVLRLPPKRFDICEEARQANASIQCPIQKGEHIVKQNFTLPSEIPNAAYTVDIRAFTVEDEDMACVLVKVDFRE